MANTLPTAYADRLTVDTRSYMNETLIDQVMDRIPLIHKLYKSNRVVISGGKNIEWFVNYGKNTQAHNYTIPNPLPASLETKRTRATADWTYSEIPMMYTGEDVVRNQGSPYAVLNTIKEEVSAGQSGMRESLSQQMFGVYGALDSTTVSAPGTGDPYSLPSMFWYLTNGDEGEATDFAPGLNTYAGIGRGANTDWFLATTGTPTSNYPDSAVDVSFDQWSYMIDGCMKRGAKRKNLLAVCGADLYRRWEMLLLTESRGAVAGGGNLSGGFVSFDLNGVTIALDDNCPDNHFYMLDTESIKWYISSQRNFDVMPWTNQATMINGADVFLSRIMLAHNFTCNKPCNNYFTHAMA